MTLTPHQIRYLLRLMNRGEGSNIRPDPSFTGEDALRLIEKLEAAQSYVMPERWVTPEELAEEFPRPARLTSQPL